MVMDKIAKQKKLVAKLQSRIATHCEKPEFKCSSSRKHRAAIRKYDELRSELEVERSILYRMEDTDG